MPCSPRRIGCSSGARGHPGVGPRAWRPAGPGAEGPPPPYGPCSSVRPAPRPAKIRTQFLGNQVLSSAKESGTCLMREPSDGVAPGFWRGRDRTRPGLWCGECRHGTSALGLCQFESPWLSSAREPGLAIRIQEQDVGEGGYLGCQQGEAVADHPLGPRSPGNPRAQS